MMKIILVLLGLNTLMYAGNGYQVFQWTDGALSNGGEDIELTGFDKDLIIEPEAKDDDSELKHIIMPLKI